MDWKKPVSPQRLIVVLAAVCFSATGMAQGGHMGTSSAGASAHIGRGGPSLGTPMHPIGGGAPGTSWDLDLNNGFGWKVMGFGGASMTTGLIFPSFGVVGSSSPTGPNPYLRCSPIWRCWPAASSATGSKAAAAGESSASEEQHEAVSQPGETTVSLGEYARRLKRQRAREENLRVKKYTNKSIPPL